MKSFESSFRNLNFSPSTSILLNLFFPFTDITCFFLEFKTSVLPSNRFAKLFKETSFSKATMVMRFPAKRNSGCPKAPRDFPPRKKAFYTPRRVVLQLLSPSPRVCTCGRTLTSQPKFLGSIDYQISLAMVLRWRAPLLTCTNVICVALNVFVETWASIIPRTYELALRGRVTETKAMAAREPARLIGSRAESPKNRTKWACW